MVRHPGHRWISQDGKAIACLCLLASWFLSRDVAVHSGVRRSISPGTSVLQVPQENAPGGDPGGTTTADATVWQNPCSQRRRGRDDTIHDVYGLRVRYVSLFTDSPLPLNRFHFFQRLCD